MTIILKNKATLTFKDFYFKCCIGKRGITKNKIEGDKKTLVDYLILEVYFIEKIESKNHLLKLNVSI